MPMTSTSSTAASSADGAAIGALHRLSHLLDERPERYATRCLHDAQSHLRAQHSSIALNVRDPGSFRGYRELHLLPLRSVGLTLGCIDASGGYELAFRSGDEMLVNIPLRGQGWVTHGARSLAMTTGQVLLVGPACAVVKHWDGPGQVLSLHIPLATLEASVQRPDAQALPLYLPPVTLLDHGRLQTLLGLVELLVGDAQSEHGPMRDAMVAEHAERLLLALLIEGLELTAPHTEPVIDVPDGTKGAVPYYVRRAELHLHAHTGLHHGIDELAVAVGVSPRTLQYGFRKVHGMSPMQFQKRLRLQQARYALRQASGPSRKVGDIAAEAGFDNVSQFSREYRAMFGESPSQTATAPRQLCAAGEP